MRQRVRQHDERDTGVLDTRLDGDCENLRSRLTENGRENGADQETNVGQAASSQNDGHGEHVEDIRIDVEKERSDIYERNDEERTQAFADGGGDAGLEAGDEDADNQWHENYEETESDAPEG